MRQKAILVDLDGTIADNEYRVKYVDGTEKRDWDKFNALSAGDMVVPWCLDLVRGFHGLGYRIVFLTARSESKGTRDITAKWLQEHIGPYVPDYDLIMRDGKDFRTDFITKQDLYRQHVEHKYDVAFAIDDKLAVCTMWRGIGIPALHCKDY